MVSFEVVKLGSATQMAKSTRGIQSVEVSGRIIQALIAAGRPMMLKDMAREAELKPAQCHAYLTSLKNIGFVHQDSSTGLYAAGALALRLGVGWMKSDPLMSNLIMKLKAVTEELGVMSIITVWGQFGPTIVHIYAGLTQAALNLRHGSSFSVTGSAIGHVFAAHYEVDKVSSRMNAELSGIGENIALGEQMSRENLNITIRQIKASGYSIEEGRFIPGLNTVAVPIFTNNQKLFAVASLIGTPDKLSVAVNSAPINKMLNLSQSISNSPQTE
jgi:DNA-binding IclR family transcriptional regulator